MYVQLSDANQKHDHDEHDSHRKDEEPLEAACFRTPGVYLSCARTGPSSAGQAVLHFSLCRIKDL